jgi:hypothetical protein
VRSGSWAWAGPDAQSSGAIAARIENRSPTRDQATFPIKTSMTRVPLAFPGGLGALCVTHARDQCSGHETLNGACCGVGPVRARLRGPAGERRREASLPHHGRSPGARCGFLRLRTGIPIHRGRHSDDRGQFSHRRLLGLTRRCLCQRGDTFTLGSEEGPQRRGGTAGGQQGRCRCQGN